MLAAYTCVCWTCIGGEEERVSTRGCFVYAKFNTDPLSLLLSLSLSLPPLLLADLLFKSGGEWRLSGARVNQSNDIFPALSFRCAAYCGGEEGNFVIFMRLGRSTRWVSRGRFETKEFCKGIENSRWDLNNEDGTRGRWKF